MGSNMTAIMLAPEITQSLQSRCQGIACGGLGHMCVMDLQGPPSARTANKKLEDLKKHTQQYTRDRGSCDDVQISYLELQEDRNNDNLRLAQMLAR
jgi:hypothetical protein